MLPWSWHEINNRGRNSRGRGRGRVRGQRGTGRSSSRGRSRFNEYIITPTSRLPIAHERLKFTSLPCGGLVSSRQDVFRSSEASSSYPDTHLADDILCDNIGNYDCYEAMDEDPSPEVEVGSPNKRRRTAGVCGRFLFAYYVLTFSRIILSLVG